MKTPGYTICVLTVVTSHLLNLAWSASLRHTEAIDSSAKCRSRFNYKYYYDHGTDNCEQCREICQYAEIMRTVEQCESECPQYQNAMKCAEKEDQFYDSVLDTCTPCSELCDNHQVRGSTRQCRQECSAYLEKLTPKQVPSRHKQNYLKAVDGSDAEESQSSELKLHPGWIAAISVGGVAIVCFIVVVIILYWTCSQQQYDPAPQEDVQVVKRPNRPRQPIEETIQGSRDSQHFAIDGASSPLPPTAFSDLRADSIHSATV